ncbi:MAG: sigma-70 family RNA polymerase sigma factor [bacterium]|nr:sigma-70 family RNA polymerase sigma factor [bacterium]
MAIALSMPQAPLIVSTRTGDSGSETPAGVREALGRARLGDRSALAELYLQYREDVGRLCGRLLGSPSEAEDAHSEVFLRAQTALASYDPKRPFRRWLLGIASHHCIDRLRRRQVEGRLFSADDLDPDARVGRGPSPLAAAVGEQERQWLSAAIDALEDRYRAPLVLRYFADLSYREIAEQLELRPGQVGVLLHRAKDRLRRELGRQGGRS